MDQIGDLELSWAQGYNGNTAAYIDKDVICYLCGSNVKFIAEDGAETVFNFPGEGVGPFAVHAGVRCFAVAEQCLNPKIYIFVYPTFREMIILEGGAKLEFSKLIFSNSDYLASVSGLPDFELVLWNFATGEKISTFSLNANPITSLSFNPGNWRQMCVTTEKEVSVLQAEQCDKHYLILQQKVRLPPDDPQAEEEEKDLDQPPTRASTRMTRYTVEAPKAAVAGLVGEMAERLDEIQDQTPRVVPVSHAWTVSGDVYVGCKGGQLLKVDGELFKARVMYYPPPRASTPHSRLTSAGSKRASAIDMQPVADELSNMVLEGSLNCIGLHRNGLYAAGEDGILRMIDIKADEFRVAEQVALGVPVSSMSFSPSYRHIALGSHQGTLHLYEAGTPESLKLLRDLHWGTFVGICPMAGNEYCVACREDGELQVLMLDNGHLISSMPIGIQVTSIACSPLLHVCVVGTVSGHVYFVDLTKVHEPRIVQRHRIYQGPVMHLIFEEDGKYLFAGSDGGHVFIIDGHATQEFKVLAQTDVKGEVQSISSIRSGSIIRVVITANTSGNKRMGADRLTTFEISDDMMKDLRKNVRSLKYDLKDDVVNKMCLKLAIPSFGAAVTTGKVVYTMSQTTKRMNQIQIPNIEDLPTKAAAREEFKMEASAEFPGHQLPGGRVVMSPHQKWMASYGTDGSVMLRLIGQMDKTLSITPHDYRHGGVKFMAFSEDSQCVLTTGYDGVITCFSWHFSAAGVSKAKSAVEAARAKKSKLMDTQSEEDLKLMGMPEWTPGLSSRPTSGVAIQQREEKEKQRLEEAIARDEIYTTPTPTPAADATWLQVQELESFKEEDKQYADTKRNLREQIREMRRTLQVMLKNNENLPDIEQLNRHEFDLDIEEQMRLQSEADAEVTRVREEIEFDNLAKMYLREMIKRECWDDMVVKGRAIQAFNSNLEVSNFPMRERSTTCLRMLDTVTKRRRIEMAENNARKDTIDTTQKPTPTTADDEGEGEEEEGKEMPSTTGSLVHPNFIKAFRDYEHGIIFWPGPAPPQIDVTLRQQQEVCSLYGGGSDLFYSQFELHTREQKTNQIVLLEDAIHRIRSVFNKEFDEVFIKKESEIAKIKEKNKRIRKIMGDLDLAEEILEPTLGILEKPESLLTVEDHEVKVEKYLTPEQRKKKEEQERLEEERRARERGDNARERALVDMMGGVLEIKKEDELKKDIPKPPCMLNKAENDWSEEEQKAVKEYERKVKELQEEREKYRKQLETELRKLQAVITEGMQAFDDTLNTLFLKKIKVMMVIYQEELKILRLRYSLLVEDELQTQEHELNRLLEHKKHLKTLAIQAVTEARKNVDAFKEQYDILLAEDKIMDKAFKKEFNDVTAVQQDQLYRMFRRRPRGQRAVKAETGGGMTFDATALNPFADRPPTARQNAQAKSYMDSALEELDKDVNRPEGIAPDVWERLCMYRRQKIENEQLLKSKALVSAEMSAFLTKRIEEDEALKNEIDGILDTINKLKEDQQRFSLNLEVQLMLKQGQVEVDAGSFIHSFKDSVLIHRSVVEDLNHTIKQLGESKIASMVESKDFRKGIIQLEWEHKKMLMQMEDFQNRMKDIQFMKVTREIQLFLNASDYDAKKGEEIGKLEQTILTQKKHHERTVSERKKTLKEIGKTIKQKEAENDQLMKELEELNVTVNERRLIDEVNAERRMDTGSEKRYQEIVQRRKLVDLAKAQAQEVAVLRAEVERLRMRTFPALVQVEH